MARLGRFIAAFAVMSVASLAAANAQQKAVPATVLSAPQPTYPQQAWVSRVEGEVRFRATLRADGTVEAIEILAVPQPNLGFEEAARMAISSWRFQPATLNGVATASEYNGVLRFELRLPGEAIFAASSHTTWNATLAVARELGLKIQKADPVDQIIVASGEYQPKKFNLTAAQLNLPKGSVSGAISLYMMVAPDLEPARVAVGAVMDILSLNRQLQMYRRYANDEIVHELLSRIAARLQVKMEPLSANPAQRAEQARVLMPAGLVDRCAVVPAVLLTAEQMKEATRKPRIVSQVAARYPPELAQKRQQGTVWFAAELTEHGTVINPEQTIHADDSGQLVVAAQRAATLWRFRPPISKGCPARTQINIEQKFILKK